MNRQYPTNQTSAIGSSSPSGAPIVATLVKSHLDQATQIFTQSGFQQVPSRGYVKLTRVVDRRTVTASVAMRSKTKYITPNISRRVFVGLHVSLHIETIANTKLLFCHRETKQMWLIHFLHWWQKNRRLDTSGTMLEHFFVWAKHPKWAEQLLAQHAVRKALQALLTDENRSPAFNVLRWSDRFCEFIPNEIPEDLTPRLVENWVQDVSSLAAATDKFPPASVSHQAPGYIVH